MQKNVESDLAIWSGSFLVEADTLLEAQHTIQANRALVEKFLRDAGVTNFIFAPIGIEELKAIAKIRRRLDATADDRLPSEPERVAWNPPTWTGSTNSTPRRWWSRA